MHQRVWVFAEKFNERSLLKKAIIFQKITEDADLFELVDIYSMGRQLFVEEYMFTITVEFSKVLISCKKLILNG